MTYTNLTLGELLSSDNETIKRNAVSILKQLQRLNIIEGRRFGKTKASAERLLTGKISIGLVKIAKQ